MIEKMTDDIKKLIDENITDIQGLNFSYNELENDKARVDISFLITKEKPHEFQAYDKAKGIDDGIYYTG